MTVDFNHLRDVFLAAAERPAGERDAFLDQACAGDDEFRRNVALMLDAHVRPGPLDRGAVRVDGAAGDRPGDEGTGTRVGPYKLIDRVGEGGMAVVWMAQQTEPVKRLVAVKLIKAGMDSRQVIARFEAERQALALMDHPNIARVLDGGTTGAGRPYFVMDLVKGVPITRYCDGHRLTPRQRLELFIPVCEAVQHAHQKGVIHRDLKPSNVLVALYDGRPVPKVIDFGVAKAAGQPLTDKTLVTAFGNIVGTLEYMSPEQAEVNQLDVDTRSDIYSLGVLLYELLAGSPPFTQKDLEKAGMLEMLRVIREKEPSKPSTKLGTSAGLPALAAQRGTESAKLTKLVQGELDWIVMKALEKDRNRRYETANALSHDISRYLADEPVQACPPSTWYRCRKFARRNTGAVLAGTSIVLLLCGGIAGTTWGLVRAERARQAEADQRAVAEAALVSERAALVSERAAKEAEAEQRARAEESGRKATREAAVAAAINDFLTKDILNLASPINQVTSGVSPEANLRLRTVVQRAAKRIDGKFPNEPEVEMRLRYSVGCALTSMGDHAGALAQFERVAAFAQKLLGRDDAFRLKAEYRRATMLRELRHLDDAVLMLEENVERHKAILGEAHPQTHWAMNGLAMTYHIAGQRDKGLRLAQQTLELRQRHLGATHGETLISMGNLGWIYLQRMQMDKALPLLEGSLAGMRAKYPPLHPERMVVTQSLAHAYHAAEQIDRAVPLQELVTGQYRTVNGPEDRVTQSCFDELIAYYVEAGSCDKAEALLKSIQLGDGNRTPAAKQRQEQRERRHRELIERVRPAAEKYRQELAAKKAEHLDTLAARQAFAVALRGQKRTTGAAYHLKAVLDARQRLLGPGHTDTISSQVELAKTRLQQRRYAETVGLLLDASANMTSHQDGGAGEPTSGARKSVK
jgi:eukaryotic-like serine/threonine-protein kinase